MQRCEFCGHQYSSDISICGLCEKLQADGVAELWEN